MEFTKKKKSQKAIECDRCEALFPLDTLFTWIPGKPQGRACCPKCTIYYKEKAEKEDNSSLEFTTISDHALVHASNAAQRGQPHLPTRRLPAQQHSGMHVKQVVGYGGSSSLPVSRVTSDGSVGYTKHHEQYLYHRDTMAKKSSGKASKTAVIIHFLMHHLKEEGKSGSLIVGNIEESAKVPATMSRVELYDFAIELLMPAWLEWSEGCKIAPEQLRLYLPPRLLLYPTKETPGDEDDPLVRTLFTKNEKFAPSAKVSILLMVDTEAYHDALEWLARSDRAADSRQRKIAIKNEDSDEEDLAADFDETPEQKPIGDILWDAAGVDKSRKGKAKAKGLSKSKAMKARPVSSHSVTQPRVVSESQRQQSSLTIRIPAKRRLVGTSSEESSSEDDIAESNVDVPEKSTGAWKPLSLPQIVPRLDFPLPNIQAIAQSLRASAAISSKANEIVNQQTLIVAIWDIPVVAFHNLVTHAQLRHVFHFDDKTIKRPIKTLVIQHKEFVGSPGAFKTTHPAFLFDITSEISTSSGAPESTIAGVQSIVAKRPFKTLAPASSFVQGRPVAMAHTAPQLAPQNAEITEPRRRHHKRPVELSLLMIEGQCIYWGTSLMDLVYSFVDHTQKQKKSTGALPISVAIPKFRFVKSAVAIGQGTHDPVYFLEEKINKTFVKYVLNSSAKPATAIQGSSKLLRRALFLCFAQHVQYELTGRKAFVSDFQGGGDLLTDCQIITDQEYATFFGAGNLTPVFDRFKEEHQCAGNPFCEYFDLDGFPETNELRARLRAERNDDRERPDEEDKSEKETDGDLLKKKVHDVKEKEKQGGQSEEEEE